MSEKPAPTPEEPEAVTTKNDPGMPVAPGQRVAEPDPTPVAGYTAVAGLAVASVNAPFPSPMAPRPLPPSFLQRAWPGPAESGGLAVPAAVVAGALGFAVFVPLGRTGIGWFIAGLITVVAVAIATRRANAEVPRAERVIRALWSLASLALLSVLTFRNAWWLVTFCVLGALGCAAVAIVGGRSIRSILFSIVAAPFASFRGLPWVGRHLSTMRRGQPNPGSSKRILWSLVVTVAILFVFGALFSSADAAFSELLTRFTPEIDAGFVVGWGFLFVVGALIVTAAVYLIAAPPDLSGMDTPSPRRLRRAEWVLPIAALVFLFGSFVAVQIAVLFGGERHVLRTAGLSYAEYARSGFWQLITVTVLTLLIVSCLARWASRESQADRVMLRVLLGLLSTLSVVIVASALFRIYTYQQAYSFTGERVFVMAFELLLGVVFVLIILAGIRLRGSWVPRTVVGLMVVMLLGLAVLNPEQYVAQRNIQRYQETGRIDLWYLRALSADATPALANLPHELRQCALMWISKDLRESDSAFTWNLGRQRARDVLTELGPTAIGNCKDAGRYDYPHIR